MSLHFSFDQHLTKIETLSGLKDFKCVNWYRIYGLAQDNNPPVLIEYFEGLPNGKTEKQIKHLLRRNGIPVVFKKAKYDTFSIGLRLDLREHLFLAAAAVNSLIGFLENRSDIDSNLNFGFSKIVETDEDEENSVDKSKSNH